MKITSYIIWSLILITFLAGTTFAQAVGDYRSAVSGVWSAATTWEVYDGTWNAASSAPTGSETITVDGTDTVNVDTDVTISGSVIVMETGILDTTSGSLTFADGSTYEHARDGGDVPIATWETGSTALFTGITNNTPANRGQDYFNLTLNTAGLLSNKDMALDGHTISGDFTVLSSGSARWRLVGGSSGTITIMGDVIVQNGASLETQGTGSATDVIINHYGNINVTDANFSISRGSQSSGTGTTVWNLFEGDFMMSNGETRNSNPTQGNAIFVFAKSDTQHISFTNVTYAGGDIHFKVADTTVLVIDQDFQVNGLLMNEGAVVPMGTLTFLDGSVYDHARDGGDVPIATWEDGSTYMLTGIVSTTPGNRNQEFYNITINTPDMTSNKDLGLDDVTVRGDLNVLNSGTARWRLTSTSANDTAIVTILGDLNVKNGASFETQGTGNALTTFIVNHYGNINVDSSNFSISRGSQGNGSGTTTWNLFNGDFTMRKGETRNSNPTPGNAILVFASADTQQLTVSDVVYAGGQIHFKVADSTTLEITQDFEANGLFINEGEVIPQGTLTFLDGSVYEHARDAGEVPTATWASGSTAMFTGITGTAPANRGQDYFNLVLNTPDLSSNRDMDLTDHTIGGDITLVNSGSSRWRLVGGDSGTVTIMGDVNVEGGSLETQGTSNPSVVEVLQYGDVNVTGGTFSIGRGSQGGIGSTKWYMLGGNFSIVNATTRTQDPDIETLIFAGKDGPQNLTLSNVSYGSGGISIQVDSAAILNLDTTIVGGAGNLIVSDGATLATGLPSGLDGCIQVEGDTMLSKKANYTFNGTEAQVPGMLLPDTLGVLAVANPAGVSFNDTLETTALVVAADAFMQIDTLGSVASDTGNVAGTIMNKGVLDVSGLLVFESGSVYNHARNGGDIPMGIWNEGSTMMLTGTVDETPGNSNQDYYNLTLNTPNLSSNKDMGLNDVTIGGDLLVQSSGSARWRLTSASAGDTAIFNINGDVIVEGGSFETQGTSNALTVFEVHHYGNVIVTGGTFAISRGSQGGGSGSTRWYMHEGNFSISDAATRNSNLDNAWFVFDKDTVQTITLSNVNFSNGGLSIEVVAGTTLDFGMSEVEGNGLFMLDDGAAMATANEGGIDSTLQNDGNISLSKSATFIFNGTTTQVTGFMMPDTVDGLTINNEAGVTLSQETLINGVLRLMAGEFDNTIPYTLGPNGEISYEGGTLKYPPVSIEEPLNEIPKVFALYQNYPNPFNPATTIRYDVPKQSHITIKIYDLLGREVAELVNDEHPAGAYKIVWNAKSFASGVYLYRITAGDFVSVRKLVLMK